MTIVARGRKQFRGKEDERWIAADFRFAQSAQCGAFLFEIAYCPPSPHYG